MPEPRPLASLTAGLLARKGQARPALRPAFTRAAPESTPVVVQQQARLASLFAPTDEVAQAAPADRRVALTLRLDDARHMQLKLLSARRRTSAQGLLVEALDAMLRDAASDGCVCGAAEA